MNKKSILKLVESVQKFKIEAHTILGKHEDAQSRIVELGSTYKKLNTLSLKQDDLFRQAITCTERGCFRAAHVMAWSAFMDFLEEKIFEDGGSVLHRERSKWKSNNPMDLREEVTEYQIIEVVNILGLGQKSDVKALLGMLNKRNECAHPSDYFPQLNETLGYISELLKRLENINKHNVV